MYGRFAVDILITVSIMAVPSTSASPVQLQRSRWVFTFNRYDTNINYHQHFMNENFKIKRAVLGYERSELNHIRHIQGYCEFIRSVRLPFVRKILPLAHWEPAIGLAVHNYAYCIKGGNFETVGDFTREKTGAVSKKKKIANSSIISGLLDRDCAPQIKVSEQYASHHSYFDKIANQIKELRAEHKFFDSWKREKLYPWQFVVLKRLTTQSNRQVTWIFDEAGNHGKSFLANYLHILYGYQVLDGTISTRDLGHVLRDDCQGIVVDVARSSENNLDYCVIESLKNGYIITGKYGGRMRQFKPMTVVVFSNFYPNKTKLSLDRWDILKMGEGILATTSKDAVINADMLVPFYKPPSMPDLHQNFDTKSYLVKKNHHVEDADDSLPINVSLASLSDPGNGHSMPAIII